MRPASRVMPNTDNNPNYQQHVFFRSADGHVQHVFWDQLAQNVQSDVWTRRTGAPLAVGEIASLVSDCRQQVFYRDAYGRINYIFWDVPSGTLHHVVLTQVANAPLAAGNPVPLETPGQLHVFYRGVDGALEHIVADAAADGMVSADGWTIKASIAGDPAVLATPGQQHAFYRGDDGRINHALYNAGSRLFGADDWTARASAPLAAADPVAVLAADEQHVFYRSADGNINHIYWGPSFGAPLFDDWTAKAGAPRAVGDRAAPLFTAGQQHVFYRAVGGRLVHILWDPGSNTFGCDDWTGRSGAPLAAGDPTAIATNGQQHAFYRSVTGSVIHILWQAGLDHPRWDDWTLRSGSAAVEGNISAFLSSEGPDPLAVRVLALGDSMTEGYAIQRTGGYRFPLFQKAHSAGKHIVFVGSRFDGPPKWDGVCFPRAHEGHSGQNIDFIASLIPQVLTSKPKIVLLMIGANDVLTRGHLDYDAYDAAVLDKAPTRLDDLLGKLIAADPGVLIVVAQIPTMNPLDPKTHQPVNPLVFKGDWDESVRNYNAGVASVVRQRVMAGARVALVDMYKDFTPATMLNTDDGTHPNDIGYEHIATVWYEAISGHLT